MKTVPFNPGWLDSGSLDLMAVYRRPRTHPITRDRVTDEQGHPLWDYVNLPLKRHNDWSKKGYQYVTLARVADLIAAKCAASEYASSYKRAGEPEERTFNVHEYLRHADVTDGAEFEALKALVYKLGSEAVSAVRRHSDPGFELPPSLQGIAAGSMLEGVVAAGDYDPAAALAAGTIAEIVPPTKSKPGRKPKAKEPSKA